MIFKRTAALIPALMLTLLCGCGAGGTEPAANYPELAASDISTMNLTEVSNDKMKMDYPADEWLADQGSETLIIYYQATADSGQTVNINAQKLSEYSEKITEKDMNDVVESIKSQFSYLTVNDAGMRMLCGEPVIYMEGVMQLTDQAIDDMLKEGIWTQEFIDSYGGREAILAIPATEQMYLYTVNNGWLYLFVGTYYQADQKDMVLSTMTVLAQTAASIG